MTKNSFTSYFEGLKAELIPRYTPPHVPAGNDRLHVDRMATYWGPKIKAIMPTLDLDVYQVTCWLHNLDVRVNGKMPWIETEPELSKLLADSPFDQETREDIVKAIKEHSKFKDEPGDSTLLTALRIADKVDKLGDSTIGIIGACAMRGIQVLAYDPEHPFLYGSTQEGKLKSIYNDFMRQLEWYEMLPSDEARALVPDESMRFYVLFVRQYADSISRVTGKANESENDLKKALGRYYNRLAG